MADIDPRLVQAFAEHADDDHFRQRIIVTQEPGSDSAPLASAGMAVTRTMGNLPITVGTVDAEALDRLASIRSVTRVEVDEEATIQEEG